MNHVRNERGCVLRLARVAAVLIVAAVLSTPARANPLGTSYNVLLDAVVTDGEFNVLSGHLSNIPFDESLDPVENDVPPQAAPNGNFNDGNLLWVNEEITFNQDGSETIDIWIFGDDDGDPQTEPQPGDFGKLFNNEVATEPRPDAAFPDDLFPFVFLEIGGLIWTDVPEGPVEFELLALGLTFNGGDPTETPTPIEPLFVDAFGEGTEDDPFFVGIDLDPADFVNMPTDLHATFTIRHIPEPASVMLLTLGAPLLLRRRRGGRT